MTYGDIKRRKDYFHFKKLPVDLWINHQIESCRRRDRPSSLSMNQIELNNLQRERSVGNLCLRNPLFGGIFFFYLLFNLRCSSSTQHTRDDSSGFLVCISVSRQQRICRPVCVLRITWSWLDWPQLAGNYWLELDRKCWVAKPWRDQVYFCDCEPGTVSLPSNICSLLRICIQCSQVSLFQWWRPHCLFDPETHYCWCVCMCVSQCEVCVCVCVSIRASLRQ